MSWRIVCPPNRFNQLRTDPAFQRLMMAAKIANAMRFAIVAAMDRNAQGEGHTTIRTRAGSFFYVSGLVQEALEFLPRLGKYYSSERAFREELAPILRDASVDSLRKGALARLRNQGVFHNDDVVMSNGLQAVALDEYVLMAGDADLGADVYFPIADIAMVHHALSTETQGYPLLAEMSDLLDQVATVGTHLCKGIDSLFRDVVMALGCSYHRE